MVVSESDMAEFTTLLRMVESFSMKTKRQIFGSLRNGASSDTFIPRLGMTYGQISTFLVLIEKA